MLLSNAFDNRKRVDAIYTDFSKAFDNINHQILLHKLQAHGIYRSLLAWLKSYLTGRLYRVRIKGYLSEKYRVTSGVPQGSHLGPFLFRIFVNDIAGDIEKSQYLLFSDDLKIYKYVHTQC